MLCEKTIVLMFLTNPKECTYIIHKRENIIFAKLANHNCNSVIRILI